MDVPPIDGLQAQIAAIAATMKAQHDENRRDFSRLEAMLTEQKEQLAPIGAHTVQIAALERRVDQLHRMAWSALGTAGLAILSALMEYLLHH